MLVLLLAAALADPAADTKADARCAAMMGTYLETFTGDAWSRERAGAYGAKTFFLGRLSATLDNAGTKAAIAAAELEFGDLTRADLASAADKCQQDMIAANEGI